MTKRSKSKSTRPKTARKVAAANQVKSDVPPAADSKVIGQFADGRVAPIVDSLVVGQFGDGRDAADPNGRSGIGSWWGNLSRTWRVATAVGAAVLGSLTFYVTAAQAYDYYYAGVKKADEITDKFNVASEDELERLFDGLDSMKPLMDQIDAANAKRDENKAYYSKMAYRLKAAEAIKANAKLNRDAETFYRDLDNAAICATDGCDRDALIADMGLAFCRADRKFGGWLAEFRTRETQATFAQHYVDLLPTIPCDAILYRNPKNS